MAGSELKYLPPGYQPMQPDYTGSSMGSAASGASSTPWKGGGGGGSFGNTGGLYTVPGKGYGTVPESVMSSPQAAPYFGMASDAAWRAFQTGFPSGDADRLRQQGYGAAMSAANLQAEHEAEQWRWLQQAQQRKQQLFQRLMALATGQGGGMGAGLNVPMPIQPNPEILNDLMARAEKPFIGQGAAQGRYQLDSSAMADLRNRARAGSYVPAMAATVQSYEPGLQAAKINQGQNQWLINLLAQLGGMA